MDPFLYALSLVGSFALGYLVCAMFTVERGR